MQSAEPSPPREPLRKAHHGEGPRKQVEMQVRRMHFAFADEGFPPDWHRGSRAISHLYAALSTSFPAGEAFFIESVRHYKDRISDPVLLREIDDFCKQEGHHTYQHVQFNRVNQQNGVDTPFCERGHEALFALVRRKLSPLHRLATTMALEHLTAVFAHRVLTDTRLMEGADPRAAALWHWHAIEELEHKSVVFDVYRAVGGGYWVRALNWLQVLVIFHSITLFQMFHLMKQDGSLWKPREVARGLRYLFGLQGFFTRVIPAYLSYFRPGFYPGDRDESVASAYWDRLQGERGFGAVMRQVSRN